MSQSGEHNKATTEAPAPAGPRPHDPIWVAVSNLGGNVGEHGKRIDKVETKLEETHTLATTAVTKVDALALKEIATQQQFTNAMLNKTTWMKAMVVGFFLLGLVNAGVLLAVLFGWHR